MLFKRKPDHPTAATFARQCRPTLPLQFGLYPLFQRILVASLCLLTCGPALSHEPNAPAPQYVLISFDGAGPLEQWHRSRALAEETGARFTYFLSCVYLVSREDRAVYKPPLAAAGRSNVGFAESRSDVVKRLHHVWDAHVDGHEIASHGCGHFDGGGWTAAQWTAEFNQFSTILADSWKLNGVADAEPDGWRDFANNEIVGFRAPYLSTGPGLFKALADAGLSYDASTVSRGPALPQDKSLTRFSLPMIPEGPNARPIIAMDYNWFVRHSGGIERGDKDSVFEERALAAMNAALEAELAGKRIPLQIGLHFTLMNDGSYWRALERFAREACTREEVRCVTYRDWLQRDEASSAANG